MSEPLAPGIYIEELSSLPHSVDFGSAGAPGLAGLSGGGLPPNRGISLLHVFPALGNRIGHALATGQDSAFQDIAVRHLAVYIEQSLDQQLQWVVFENNGPSLWALVSLSVAGLMNSLWQSGSLKGTKPQQAYFVRCDATTMTPDDLESGRLIVIVGFAPVRPAEFIVIRITVQTKKK